MWPIVVDECKCTMAQKMTGDGCEACNPELALDIERENHEETKDALRALLHYIDHSGTWPEWWSMERVREVASQ